MVYKMEEKMHICKKCGIYLGERGTDEDIEYSNGLCAECYSDIEIRYRNGV